MLRVYLDNVAACGRVLGDLRPDVEQTAIEAIERAHSAGRIKRVTSRESWREQGRTNDPETRAQLEAARDEVSVVQSDHRVLGSNRTDGLYGYGTSVVYPLVTDIPDPVLFADLKVMGLEDSDAKHLMYAAINGCERFVTLDRGFLDRRAALEARCPSLRIVTPSQMANELPAE